MANYRLFFVQQINNKQLIVNLEAQTCTCGNYQENDIPCGHALRSFHHIGQSANDYISDAFSITTLRNTYPSNFNPIVLVNLDSFILNPQPVPPPCSSPSELQIKLGQPKVNRATRPSYWSRIAHVPTNMASMPEADHP